MDELRFARSRQRTEAGVMVHHELRIQLTKIEKQTAFRRNCKLLKSS
ncbi:hypothetical protein LEP1GSC137_2278 [Leptospira borgpetersenii str. Noumea 25]|uniref:Uncharacterized protein n=2 Tax=Leptospira borgpetersenii TaxID=174 RepID=M3HW15_LEPBO|nr:hypothetical protein LEP1GSC121_0693 [Leptospira borgpetersenii serovar Castellonis str. 200801910]EMG02251.1 hypothetical protein LEP1GSC123_0854 [Leptospira borgpetersenii str. 200701203]EMN13324.1 hypothetical protein LEP1GSC055_1134 [Leptospira borgpetersenii str. Brem 307]EMN16197.1 hypothetical protein LEP1GSC056_0915 [Leptospira borgpetersenii str. Brem 328]EMN57189.1 hypothetical protein LEP1GSC090_0032 [Leptospira borgpetersenii serovar Javanica str. MK146]EMO09432.1 hypothetical p